MLIGHCRIIVVTGEWPEARTRVKHNVLKNAKLLLTVNNALN